MNVNDSTFATTVTRTSACLAGFGPSFLTQAAIATFFGSARVTQMKRNSDSRASSASAALTTDAACVISAASRSSRGCAGAGMVTIFRVTQVGARGRVRRAMHRKRKVDCEEAKGVSFSEKSQ